MNFSNLQLIKTADGSNTLGFADEEEHYHSVNGAVSESTHVYINAGLQEITKSKNHIWLLEVGFGTGLNAYLSKLFAEKYRIRIDYTALEPFPLTDEIYTRLNYVDIVKGNNVDDFIYFHTCEWNKEVKISPFFNLNKIKSTVETYDYPSGFFDLVYFDAFAPRFQPGLWTEKIFHKIFCSMCNCSVLTTYCCKGDVKRNLQKTGFTIEKLPGFGGKREMLRARKK